MRVALMLALECGLGVLAILLGALFGVASLAGLRFDLRALVAGALATIPMLAMLLCVWRSNHPSLRLVRERMFDAVRELFPRASLAELACVSAAAGFGEEALFRGFLQGGLEHALGSGPALIAASVAFGLVHPVTRAYVVLASLLGAYLGTLWLVSGNLLAPMVAHGLYDFIALTAVVRSKS
jgi:membrane protease YdiL (CAAX protease family)